MKCRVGVRLRHFQNLRKLQVLLICEILKDALVLQKRIEMDPFLNYSSKNFFSDSKLHPNAHSLR